MAKNKERSKDPLAQLKAPSSDIVRSFQKDQFSIKQFQDDLTECVMKLRGPRFVMKYQKELPMLADLFFHSITTLLGNQTLGEEYCDILQVKGYQAPSLQRRLVLVLLHSVAPYLLIKACDRAEQLSRSAMSIENKSKILTPERIVFIEKNIPKLKLAVESIQRLHLATFYFTGVFYNTAKRLAGIKFISTSRSNNANRPQYHILGALIFIQFAITLAMSVKKSVSKQFQPSDSQTSTYNEADFESPKKCSLCLENRKRGAATPCGHLFCYACITEWCNTKSQCPLCRQEVDPSAIVCVYQY
eukprot:TRINITY_DN6586_c0_g1_i2.p1 TRINITY_DN6586_c0_g1~~TRINITY_DN6586_c0_g1_i2.p1  ORF type:complete len:302 (+),score=32.30 TRINITY_DN6586_c0_g1_i2:35-940(+)